MKKYVITSSGVKVFLDWKDNIIVDNDLPPIVWKSSQKKDMFFVGKAKGLPKIASENSEDALSWNFFRFLEKNAILNEFMSDIGFDDDFDVYYWYRKYNDWVAEEEIQDSLNLIEPWAKGGRRQQTETDIILRGKKKLTMIENKLGKSNTKIEAWNRKSNNKVPVEYSEFYKSLSCEPNEKYFVRYYQLYRHLILGSELGRRWSLQPCLISIVNSLNRNANNNSHEIEFNKFSETLFDSDRVRLYSWQDITLKLEKISTLKMEILLLYLKCHPCLRV